jgi:uncharacterized protein with PIN domain
MRPGRTTAQNYMKTQLGTAETETIGNNMLQNYHASTRYRNGTTQSSGLNLFGPCYAQATAKHLASTVSLRSE